MVDLSDRLAQMAVRARGIPSRWARTSAGRVHVTDLVGRGPLPPIAVIHGFSAAGAHYASLLFRLRRHVRRIVAPDMPGHGLSDVPADLSPRSMRAGLFEALDQTLDEPAVVIGNSMGGLASIRYANHSPDRVRGLVLISPAGAYSSPLELEALRRTFEVPTHSAAVRFVDRLFPRRNRLRHVYAFGLRRKFHDPLMRRILDCLEPEMLDAAELATLRVPIHLIFGRGDRIFPDSHREFFRDHLPDHAEIEEPPELGHAPFLDRPDALTSRILSFLHRRCA